jgi:Ser/Thr protein kinase RdoA (MazF antagonist)
VKTALVEKAANAFMGPGKIAIESLGHGLIHHTYKVGHSERKIVLQAINTEVFKKPEDIIYNYRETYQYLEKHKGATGIPEPLQAINGQFLWTDEENNCWRALEFVHHSYSPLTADNEEAAYTVSKNFAAFTRSLEGLNAQTLKEIIPDFHNLSFRYGQFEKAVAPSQPDRLMKATPVISSLRERRSLVDYYETLADAKKYPFRLMHHDCKISNILFDSNTGGVICPVDLDTLMPGKFISDLGDMIRTMACSEDEDSIHWESIRIRSSFYDAILKGYLEGIGPILTKEEKKNIHYSGLLLVYMQALRFLTDFLEGDRYYKTSYPEQNLKRALNQLTLLERLEGFLKAEYSIEL